MGLFDRRAKKMQVRSIIREYYGNNASYFAYNYAQNIYNIPEVRTAIESFADIFSTIPIYRERVRKDGSIEYFDDRALTLKPNPLQNATQFWKEVITRLMLESNVFIEPIFDRQTGELKHLYVLPARYFEFTLVDDGTAMVRFYDKNKNPQEKYNLDSLIYLNRFSSLTGGKKNNLGLHETVVQALMQQAANVASPKKVRALMQGKTGTSGNLKAKDSKGEMQTLKANFDENVDGVAYVDSHWDITPINWQENDVNRDLMALVVNTVYNYFGNPEKIINGTANELEIAQFITNKINPLARQIEREFTAKLFTAKEIAYGNRVELDTFALQVKTTAALTTMFNVALRAGVLNIDEAREYIGQPPLPDGLGQMYRVTADTIDIRKVNEYQAAQKGVADNKESAPDNSAKEVKSGTESNDVQAGA